jgi:two-component sensor histidine kinase
MKTLDENITALEQQIKNYKGEALAAIYLELAELSVLVNTNKSRDYLLKTLQLTAHSETETVAKTKLLLAANTMNKLATAEALPIAMEALAIAENKNFYTLQALIKAKLALINVYSGKNAEALQLINESLTIANNYDDINLHMDVYGDAAFVYMDKDLVKSGEYAFKFLSLAKQSGKDWQIGYAHAVLGYWARENKVDQDTYFHFNEARKHLKKQEAHEYYGNVLTQISICEKNNGNFDTALALLEEAQIIFHKVKNERLIVINAIVLGRLYRAQKIYDKAENYYKEAYNIALKNHIDYEAAAASVFLGYLKRDNEQFEEAIYWLEKGIEAFGANIRPSSKADLAKHLHPLYYKIGNLDKAYQTLLNYTEIRLQLQDENRIKETALLQTKYEAEKREAELKEALLQQTESELKALKAQMNPHFIFNALNSIQEIFFLGDKRLANKHLARFSQLMRNILKASGQKNISLQDEINMLEEYLSLEQLRFGSSFQYTIEVAESVDIYTIEVPPMIIQPFVENSVKHGLLHKEGEQTIKINFNLNENNNVVEVTLTDNGIGRKASALINQHRKNHDSFSTAATEKRFEILNQYSAEKFAFTYFDLEDNDGNSLGTKVTIALPVEA